MEAAVLLSPQFALAYCNLIYSDKQFDRLASVVTRRYLFGLAIAEDLAIIRLTGGFVEY